MRIRWKLLILLLAIALFPLALMAWFAGRTTRELGAELAEQARTVLSEAAQIQLKQTIEEYGRVVLRDISLLEFALRSQAKEVERALAAPPPADVRLLTSRELRDPDFALPGAQRSIRHAFSIGREQRQPGFVSYRQPVLHTPPGVENADVRDDMRRLAIMGDALRFLRESTPDDLILWQRIVLDSGVHATFPAHAHTPADLDLRTQLRPRDADRRTETVSIGRLARDPETQLDVLTLWLPVHRPDGAACGTTAIIVRARDLFRKIRLPVTWAVRARLYLVEPQRPTPDGDPQLHVIAWKHAADEDGDWIRPDDAEWLVAGDVQYGQMLDKLSLGQSGVWKMLYEDVPQLWGHAAVPGCGVHVVALVPHEAIIDRAAQAEDRVLTRFNEQNRLTGYFVLTLVAGVFALALLYSRSITRPLAELTRAARRIAQGDFAARANVPGSDEIGELGRTFNEMIPQLHDGMRLRESLALAQEVQQALLPGKPPEFAGFDIHGVSYYCEQTGGDYYDFLDIAGVGPGRLGIAVGDVTGHGIAAALLMATARALLRGRAGDCGSLGELLTDINRHLSHGAPPDRYMTLYYMVIDADKRSVRWASAGHDAAIVYSPAADEFSEMKGDGIPLALEPGWKYAEHDGVTLSEGQIVLIGTDGIWEMRNPRNDMFGKDAVRELIRRHAGEPAERIVRAVTDALRAFRGSRAQEDDVTLVVVRTLTTHRPVPEGG